jgi:hypothetical protein
MRTLATTASTLFGCKPSVAPEGFLAILLHTRGPDCSTAINAAALLYKTLRVAVHSEKATDRISSFMPVREQISQLHDRSRAVYFPSAS